MGWKLVRDHTETAARSQGVSGIWRPATETEIIPALTRKLFEEAGEFSEAHDPGELYDLLEVVTELINRLDPTGDTGRRQQRKSLDIGGFTRGILWHPNPSGQDTHATELQDHSYPPVSNPDPPQVSEP